MEMYGSALPDTVEVWSERWVPADPYSPQYEYLHALNQPLQERAAPLSVPINLLVCAAVRLYPSSQHIANIYLLCQAAHLT